MVSAAALLLFACVLPSPQDRNDRAATAAPAPQERVEAATDADENATDADETGEVVMANADDAVARLTRIADPVAKLSGEARSERMLFHWNKFADLMNGDGARQGDAGISEVTFTSDLSTVRMFGATQFSLERALDGRLEMHFDELHRLVVSARDEGLRVVLDDGTTLDAGGTWLRVTRDELDRRYVIRNGGPFDLEVSGSTHLRDVAVLRAGESVEIPITRDSAAIGESGVRADVWQGMVVRAEAGVDRGEAAGQLVLSGEGTAEVGGAKIVLTGQRVLVRRPRIERSSDDD
ncbi:MAG: hypothetical protein IPH13_13245 [Planctomycetes bacterium]|nr:hypothetical protein [Planctomycetota bacterium]MCC7172880.1 hypothetical protein [Planctomycetota bacterium]